MRPDKDTMEDEMRNKTLGDELHEENAQAEYNRMNRRVGKCKICGTQHIGVIYGYCPDHQRERAEAAERESDELRSQLATVTAERDAIRRAMQDYMNDAFAHTAPPTDWDQETPLGQMLDGIGDEVE